jgi:hypothetical protein
MPLTWRRSLSAYLELPMMPRLGVVTRYGCSALLRRSSLCSGGSSISRHNNTCWCAVHELLLRQTVGLTTKCLIR